MKLQWCCSFLIFLLSCLLITSIDQLDKADAPIIPNLKFTSSPPNVSFHFVKVSHLFPNPSRLIWPFSVPLQLDLLSSGPYLPSISTPLRKPITSASCNQSPHKHSPPFSFIITTNLSDELFADVLVFSAAKGVLRVHVMESLDRVGDDGYAQFVGDGDPPVDLENSLHQPFTQEGLVAYVNAI